MTYVSAAYDTHDKRRDAKADFEIREMSKEEFERLKSLLL
jgi:hypothetical protein